MERMVSVIVMFYNHEKYVEQALLSVLEQEHNYSWEIIVCDDCSSDGTASIIKKYVDLYPNVIKPIFREHNKGLIYNRSDLIKRCNGKYIYLLDGDDYWLPGKIKTQTEFLETHLEADVCTGTEYLNETSDGRIKSFVAKKGIPTPFPAMEGCHSDMAFRADIIKRYVEEVRPVDHIWEFDDVPFVIWLGRHARLGIIDKSFYISRNTKDSVSRPLVHDLAYRINRYRWSLDMYYFFTTGKAEEKDFIEKYELQYNTLLSIQDEDAKMYRQCLRNVGGIRQC